MAREIREIFFNDEETALALRAALRRTMSGPINGRVAGIVKKVNDDGQTTVCVIGIVQERGAIVRYEASVEPEALCEALVAYCLENNVMLPRRGHKEVRIAPDGTVVLHISVEDTLLVNNAADVLRTRIDCQIPRAIRA